MGIDLTIIPQMKSLDGLWVDLEGNFYDGSLPWNWRSYGIYGFLANVRNISHSPFVFDYYERDLPDDFTQEQISEGGSYCTLDEILAIDFDQRFEDRRTVKKTGPNSSTGAHVCAVGDGEWKSIRDHLGQAFFEDLEELKNIDAQRLIFYASH